MKRTFVKFVSTRALAAMVIAGSVLMAVPFQTKANTGNLEIISDNNQASVQYIGTVDNALIFSVRLDNINGDKFTLVIRDENGHELYSREYNDKNFSRKIKLVKSDDVSRYSFVIKSVNKELEQTYAVSTETKIIDEVVVTKL